jgi:arsenate reductase
MDVIYHNQHCSKSRGACELLKTHGRAAQVIDYVAQPPSLAELERLSRLLGVGALGMMRTDDKLFAELGLSTGDQRTEAEWFELIRAHPLLLQRPIVVIGERAVIARPSEKVLELLR